MAGIGSEPPREATVHVNRLVQVAQHADDLDRAAEFYQTLLGVPPSARYDPPGLLFFTVGGVRLLLEQGASSAVAVPAASTASGTQSSGCGRPA